MSAYDLLHDIENTLGFDRSEAIEAARAIANGEADFEVSNHRFIKQDEIDKIQQDELSSDEYTLGCFNAGFIANVCGIDMDAVERMQECEAFEGLGMLILSLGKIEEIQQEYASADGYGHHFAHYDGEEHEIGDYLAFRVN